MPRPQHPWFRFYVETVDDEKIMRHGAAALGLWAVLMAMARKSPISGSLMISEATPHTIKTIAGKARMTDAAVKKQLSEFERDGMVGFDRTIGAWSLTNWKQRQYESDTSSLRMAKHRHNAVTVTPPDTETDTDRKPSSSSVLTHDVFHNPVEEEEEE